MITKVSMTVFIAVVLSPFFGIAKSFDTPVTSQIESVPRAENLKSDFPASSSKSEKFKSQNMSIKDLVRAQNMNRKAHVEQMPSQRSLVGTESGGGGDTDVIEFLQYARRFASHLSEKAIQLGVTSSDINSVILKLEQSLNSGEKAKLSFTQDILTDQFGIQKMAVFERNLFYILVDRNLWSAQNPQAKSRLVEIEILGLAGSQERYSEVVDYSRVLQLSYRQGERHLAAVCGKTIDLEKIKHEDYNYEGGINYQKPYLMAHTFNAGSHAVTTICETPTATALIVELYLHNQYSQLVLFFPLQNYN
ncbi:MAG TPA: hypothetical protein VN132_09445 [Bdellovibrio sp.]|nr:hypothetical protein [Bdellovibrio sp.]